MFESALRIELGGGGYSAVWAGVTFESNNERKATRCDVLGTLGDVKAVLD